MGCLSCSCLKSLAYNKCNPSFCFLTLEKLSQRLRQAVDFPCGVWEAFCVPLLHIWRLRVLGFFQTPSTQLCMFPLLCLWTFKQWIVENGPYLDFSFQDQGRTKKEYFKTRTGHGRKKGSLPAGQSNIMCLDPRNLET